MVTDYYEKASSSSSPPPLRVSSILVVARRIYQDLRHQNHYLPLQGPPAPTTQIPIWVT
jgi:hypothetical protein